MTSMWQSQKCTEKLTIGSLHEFVWFTRLICCITKKKPLLQCVTKLPNDIIFTFKQFYIVSNTQSI